MSYLLFDIKIERVYSFGMNKPAPIKSRPTVRKTTMPAELETKRLNKPGEPVKAANLGAANASIESMPKQRRKATTLRLAPHLQLGLELLQGVSRQPINKMVNEAVEWLIERRTAEVESRLGRMLDQIKAYKEKDPDFESAMKRVVDAELGLLGKDPAEGVAFTMEPEEVGASRTMVRNLLNR